METSNTWVDVTITRGPIRGRDRNTIGLILRIKAHPDVEMFMSGLANGRKTPIDNYSDVWQNVSPVGEVLEVYDGLPTSKSKDYELDAIGGALIISTPQKRALGEIARPADEVVNLSFLRLAGISNDSGISIGIVGAYSSEYIKKIRNQLPTAIKQLLQDFMVPVTVNLQVLSRG